MQLCHEKGRHLHSERNDQTEPLRLYLDTVWCRDKRRSVFILCKSGNDRMQNRT